MRQNLDPTIRQLLDISRAQWATRTAMPDWTAWLSRSCEAAFRELAPHFQVARIHSLPGNLWEVLRDSNGTPWLIADDELVASLAELRNLALPDASIEAGESTSELPLPMPVSSSTNSVCRMCKPCRPEGARSKDEAKDPQRVPGSRPAPKSDPLIKPAGRSFSPARRARSLPLVS